MSTERGHLSVSAIIPNSSTNSRCIHLKNKPRMRALWAIPALIAIAQIPASAACTPPTGGGVAICSPQAASNDVNPVHYIAAASSPSCAGGIATMSIQPKPGVTAYSVGGPTLDTFLPQAPGSYTTTVVAK